MESSASVPTRTVTTTASLTRRLLVGVVLAVLAFVGANRAALLATSGDEMVAMVLAVLASIGVATVALRRTVAPVVARHADLQVRYEAALADALRDPLTGLGNHRAFHEELDRQVAAALRYEVPLSLLLLDLDDFKAINDGRGHAEGDRVLRGFGQLLTISLRRADRAFRIGGDEFAVLLPHTDLDGGVVASRRLLAQALQPTWRARDIEPVSFSGGVSALPELGLGPAQLYAQADAALYAAKRSGRTEVTAFEPTMVLTKDGSASSATAAVADVIARGHLRPAYQPIVSLPGRHVIGVEGLIRPIAPAPFADPTALFAAAEAGGRLVALDMACIEAIVREARHLPDDQFLSVNLTLGTAESAEFSSGALLAILARFGFPPERLVVELTERHQLHDPERVRGRMEAWRRAGIRFAADDIGAGNAGLRLLAELSFDILKVDLSLVQRSASEGQSSAVLGSVVDLAARTGALVVAEGIEEGSQIQQLVALGITAGQGFTFGRPGPLVTALPAPVGAADQPTIGVAAWRQSIGLTSVN